MAQAFSDFFGFHDNRRVFDSLESFRSALDQYGLAVGCAYRIRSSDRPRAGQNLPRRRLFICTRGGPPSNTSTGARQKKSAATNCLSTVSAKLLQDGSGYVAAQVNLEHNHPVDPISARYMSQHRRPTEQQMQVIDPMLRHGVASSSICKFARAEFLKPVFTKDVNNWRSSMESNCRTPNYLLSLSAELNRAGRAQCILNEENYMTHFIFMTATQLAYCRKYSEVIGMDATYSVCREAYVLFQLVAIDANRIAFPICFAFVSQETTDAIEVMLRCYLRFAEGRTPRTILMDDSAASQAAVQRVFPDTRILLCRFHLLRHLKARVRFK